MNETTEQYGEGWAMPVLGVGTGNGAKAHFYSAGFQGFSLCGKYTLLGGQREMHTHESPDNCMACRRRLAKDRPELGVKLPKQVRVRFRESLVEDGWTWVKAGTTGIVRGMVADQLRAQANRGGSVDVEVLRPRKRCYFVKAATLEVL